MGQPMMPRIHVYETIAEMSRDVAGELARHINLILKQSDFFSLVLTGGNTPRNLYGHLAESYRDKIPWEKVRLYWSDERFVPHDSSENNFRMAKETMLDHLPIPTENIFPMPTDHDTPARAAEAYEKLLQSQFNTPWPRFDMIILGLGNDGHIASLFSNTKALHERERWVVEGEAPSEPRQRISLTMPVIESARMVFFLVSGANKAEPFRRAAQRIINIDDCPACAIRLHDGELEWWVDKEAAGALFTSRK